MKSHTNHSSTTEGKCVSMFSFYLSFSISLMPFISSFLHYFSAFQLVSFLISLCNFLFVPIDFPSYFGFWPFLFLPQWFIYFVFFSFPFCFIDLSFLFIWVTTLVSVDDAVAGFYRQRASLSRVCCFIF